MPSNQTQRPKFFEEQYLGAADLTAVVDYGRVQQARHVLGAHTWGIAVGLALKETPQAGGAVSVHLLPGYAWDGYGRPVVALSPYQIPAERFSAIKFDPSIDTDGKGRLIPVWLCYDETATHSPRPGFEVCDVADQLSRIQESFRIEIGDQPADRYSGVNVAAKNLTDARTALKAFDPAAPLVPDESIPQQNFPDPQSRARWLIPVGYVRWLPMQNQAGHFVARDDSGAGGLPKDSDQIRIFRRYAGVVAEAIEAADGRIRLKNRSNGFPDDLVWVEGGLRIEGDLRLFNHKLDFRDSGGSDNGAPLSIKRVDGAGARLQVVIGKASAGANAFAVGPLDNTDKLSAKLTVRDDGKVGIGTTTPRNPLGIRGTGPSEELISFEDPAGTTKWHINQNLSGSNPGLNFVETGVADGRLFIKAGGKVGIGTTTPRNPLGIRGTGPSEELISFEDPTGTMKWHINQNLGGSNPGLNFVETGVADGRVFIKAGGNVGIGTTSPGYTLHVEGSAFKPGGGPWTGPSDERLKKNIEPLTGALTKLTALRGVVFEWKQPEKQGNLTGKQIGLIAREVEKIFPEWVGADAQGYKNLTVRGFEALTIEALRELKNDVEDLKKRVGKVDARGSGQRQRGKREPKEKSP